MEQSILRSVPYFGFEEQEFDQHRHLVTTGTLAYRRPRSGKLERFRVRLEYPDEFPRHWQLVFDLDKRFTPCADGHLLKNNQICLTYPDRKEFSVGSDCLTEEVLGATLVWFEKRLIYDRTGDWPGKAERHGTLAKIDLVLEQAGLETNPLAVEWANQFYVSATNNGGHVVIDVYDPCPCGKEKKLKFCHGEALRPLLKLIRSTQRSAITLEDKTP